MTSQLTAIAERLMSDRLPEAADARTLDLMDGSQAVCVELKALELVERVKDKRLHGIVQLEDWADGLTFDAAQRQQAVDYIDTKLEEYGYKLVWFAHGGLRYGYRFARL